MRISAVYYKNHNQTILHLMIEEPFSIPLGLFCFKIKKKSLNKSFAVKIIKFAGGMSAK